MSFKLMLPNPSTAVKVVKDWVTTIVPATKFILSGSYASFSLDDKISWGPAQKGKLSIAFWVFAASSLLTQLLTIFNTLVMLTWTGLLFSSVLTMVFSVAVWVLFSQLPQVYKNPYVPFYIYAVFGIIGAIGGVTAVFSIFGSLGRLTQGSGWIAMLGAIINLIGSIILMDLVLGVVRGENQFANLATHQFGGTPFRTPNPFKEQYGIIRGPQSSEAQNPFEAPQPAQTPQPSAPTQVDSASPFASQQVQGNSEIQQGTSNPDKAASDTADDPMSQWMDML